jgi:hypothetical protein
MNIEVGQRYAFAQPTQLSGSWAEALHLRPKLFTLGSLFDSQALIEVL